MLDLRMRILLKRLPKVLGRTVLRQYFMALISGVLIALAFLFPRLFFLMWFAFVPLLYALHKASVGRAYFLGLVAGCAMSIAAAYWIDDFIFSLKGYAWPIRVSLACFFWLVNAHILALLALFYRFLSKITRFSSLLMFPVLVTLLFAFFPSMFPVQLGASQSHFLIALQAIEFTGVYGLDFILALVNILLFNVLNKRSSGPFSVWLAYVAFIGWFGYGIYALPAWDNSIETLPTIDVGVVQTNEMPSVHISPPTEGFTYAYPKELAYSQELAGLGAELIIWPEARHRGYFSHTHVAEAFRHYAKDFSVPIVFQDNESINEQGKVKRFNTSVFINKQGEEQARYRKVKRIPVGEYLPIFDRYDTAKGVLRDYLGDFFSDLSAGQGAKVYHFGTSLPSSALPLICYELIFPRFVAKAIPAQQGPFFLIGQSNNSWFGNTRQPYQHLRTAIMRSVENRLPLIYSSNNGPSALISPSGRILAQTSFGEEGAYSLALPLLDANEKTIFGRYPEGFLWLSMLVFLLSIVDSAASKISLRK